MKRIEARTLGLLTIDQAAEKRGVTSMTIRNWINRGILPVVVFPGGEREFFLVKERDLAKAKAPTMGRPASQGRPRGPDAGRKLPATGG